MKHLLGGMGEKMKRVKLDGWHVVFAILFAAMLLLSRHVVNLEVDVSTVDTTYIVDFHWFDIIIYLVLLPICYLTTEILSKIMGLIGPHLFGEARGKKWWLIPIFTIVIFICWIPYLMTYRPGGIYFDTVDSLNMALGNAAMENHNPIAYTLLWRLVFWMKGVFRGESIYKGLNAFTELQCLLLAAGLSTFIYLCYKRGMKKQGVALCVLIAAAFPLYPFYGISLWKDTIFSLVVFLFALYLYHFFREWKEDVTIPSLVLFGILLAATAFFRNNGIYVDIILAVILFLVCIWKHRKLAVKFGSVSAGVILVCTIILGPVFTACGYNIDTKSESMGIPIQQVAYILSTDGNLEGTDLELLNEIMPLEEWKSKYDPVVADTIKFTPEFNKAVFEEKSGEFMKEYLHLVKKNPVKAVKAYLLATLGFWDISENSPTAYISNFHFGNAEYFMSDYFDYYFGFSFGNIVSPRTYLSAALMVWLLLFALFECLSRKNYKGLIALIPTFGIWLTIMLATPIANSFRYVYALFLCIPIYLLTICDCNQSN